MVALPSKLFAKPWCCTDHVVVNASLHTCARVLLADLCILMYTWCPNKTPTLQCILIMMSFFLRCPCRCILHVGVRMQAVGMPRWLNSLLFDYASHFRIPSLYSSSMVIDTNITLTQHQRYILFMDFGHQSYLGWTVKYDSSYTFKCFNCTSQLTKLDHRHHHILNLSIADIFI